MVQVMQRPVKVVEVDAELHRADRRRRREPSAGPGVCQGVRHAQWLVVWERFRCRAHLDCRLQRVDRSTIGHLVAVFVEHEYSAPLQKLAVGIEVPISGCSPGQQPFVVVDAEVERCGREHRQLWWLEAGLSRPSLYRRLRAEGVRWLDLGSVDTEAAPGLARFKLGTGAALKRLGATCLVLP